jgi:hypothetical protein
MHVKYHIFCIFSLYRLIGFSLVYVGTCHVARCPSCRSRAQQQKAASLQAHTAAATTGNGMRYLGMLNTYRSPVLLLLLLPAVLLLLGA